MDDPINQDRAQRGGAKTNLGLGDGTIVDGEFTQRVTSLVNEEPRTVSEVHQMLGSDVGLTRDQTEYRLGKLTQSGAIKSKKPPGRTSSRIFFEGDTK